MRPILWSSANAPNAGTCIAVFMRVTKTLGQANPHCDHETNIRDPRDWQSFCQRASRPHLSVELYLLVRAGKVIEPVDLNIAIAAICEAFNPYQFVVRIYDFNNRRLSFRILDRDGTRLEDAIVIRIRDRFY